MFQCLTPYHGGTVAFGGKQKGRITGAGKIGIHPYPFIDNVLFVEGFKHNLLSISQLCESGYGVSSILYQEKRQPLQNKTGRTLGSKGVMPIVYKGKSLVMA